MVHDLFPSDMWFHDVLNEWSPISDGHVLMKHSKKYGYSHVVENRDNLERKLETVARCVGRVENYLNEITILGGYYKSGGVISSLEYQRMIKLYNDSIDFLNAILKNYLMFRGWRTLSTDEYDILYDRTLTLIKYMREKLQDAYIFEREIERRVGIQPLDR